MKRFLTVFVGLMLVSSALTLADSHDGSLTIPPGAKVYIAPNNGFESYLSAAIMKKAVPVSLVADRGRAAFEITSAASSDKAGWKKALLTGSFKSDEHASITVVNLKTGAVVYAYSYDMDDANSGQKSAAESCAKHLKSRIEKGK